MSAKPLAILDRINAAQINALQRALLGSFARAYAPPPKMPLSDWADKYRVLSPEAAATPGRWKTANEPMAKGVMDTVTDPLVEKVTAMCGAQVLKTEFVLNSIGYYAHGEPGPMLIVYPTVEGGEMFSKERLAPMVRDTPVLRKVFRQEKSRASDSTILQKSFTGGRLSIVGANAPAGLASRPIRFVLADEVDRFPASAGGGGQKSEGDPIGLAEERTATFANRKIVLVSTPTLKGISRIEASYLQGDQRRYYVPCPHCGVKQVIEWAGVRWDKDADGEHDPSTARYVCRKEASDPETGEFGCGVPWTEAERQAAVSWGVWIASRPFKGHASFHASQLSSKRMPLSQVVKKFLEAKDSVESLKKWTNLSLAETWEDGGEKVDPDSLLGRREPYGVDPLPDGVGMITNGIDIQRNRWEGERVGWGSHEESWSLEYKVHYADPATPEYWDSLREWIFREFEHPSGVKMRAEATCVDSGDQTQRVYDFCRPLFSRNVYAIKGPQNSIGKPIWPKKATRNAAAKVDVFLIGLDEAKSNMQANLMKREAGPGHCHFPINDNYDEAHFKGLTIEKSITKYKFGVPYREWHNPPGGRNEPWDCRIYAYAAFKSRIVDITGRLAAMWAAFRARGSSPTPMAAPTIGKRGRRVRSSGASA